MSEVKITRLTDFNVRALRELLTEEQATRVTIGETVATFDMALVAAIALVVELQQRAAQTLGIAAHPYKSLFAPLKKLRTLQKKAAADAAAATRAAVQAMNEPGS